MKIGLFGPTGMLGSAVVNYLSNLDCDLVTIGRTSSDLKFDVLTSSFAELDNMNFDYLINCIGKITHNIDEENLQDVKEAELTNTSFSLELAAFAERTNSKLIQIATDCVYSGKTGGYVEDSPHDANDVYGISKSKGEANSPNAMHIRCSIIGPELSGKKSLLEWVLNQPAKQEIIGYTDRIWNGVTTYTFAKVIYGVISSNLFLSGVHHLVPADTLTKYELVKQIATIYDRADIGITPAPSGVYKNLTLSTNNPEFNQLLWESAGYSEIPTIHDLISELRRNVG